MLIADDNMAIVDILKNFAEASNYEVTTAFDGEEALKKFRESKFDVILLDVMMPKIDGFEVCKIIRSESNVPILMITARSEDYDKIMGLDIGADDYIVKPFSAAEVMARVRAVLRRLERNVIKGSSSENFISYSNLTVNFDTCQAVLSGNIISLTRKELDLLWLLIRDKNRVFSRDYILDRLWTLDYEGGTRAVDTHIKRIRAKLSKFPHPDWQIKTIYGIGYTFEVKR